MEGLRLLDPELAALYERGLGLTRELDSHGSARLVAYIGRELSRGVLRRVLEDEGLAFTEEEFGQLPEKERNRASIARALHLPPEDPRVDDWFRLPRLFASWEKYDNAPPPPAEVLAAYERLGALLYGRVAPYYATEADLDVLLGVAVPTAEHVAALRDLQLRPGQRRYFFDRVQDPAWIPLMVAQGVFKSPPGRRQHSDGSWSGTPWPEGNYLVRMVGAAPESVLDAILGIPVDNDNPAVWDAIARAAAGLPADLAAQAVPRLLKDLASGSAWFAAGSVVEVAATLAASGRAEAFEIAEYVLFVIPWAVARQQENLRYRSSTEWVFPRLGRYDAAERMTRLVGALEAADPKRTLRMLLSKLHRIQDLADNMDLSLWWHLSRSERRGSDDHEDVVSLLVDLTVGTAQRTAAGDSTEAEGVFELLQANEGHVFRSVQLMLLARVGQLVPGRLDETLASPPVTEPDYPATEVAALLRAQFGNASEAARAGFVDALTKLGGGENQREILRRWHGREPTDDEVLEDVRHTQRRILTFFRGKIPAELRGLSEVVGMWGVEPSYRDQQLAEIGSYSEAGSWGGPASGGPSAEQLARWSVDEVLDLVSSPAGADGGLFRDLSGFAHGNTVAALDVLARAGAREIHPLALEGLFSGLQDAVKAGDALDWRKLLGAIKELVEAVARIDPDQPDNRAARRRTVGRAIRIVQSGAREDAIPIELAREVWSVLQRASEIPVVWNVADPEREHTVQDVIMAELNDATGDIANGVLSVGLWHFRAISQEEGRSRDEAKAVVEKELVQILDGWIRDVGPNAAVPRAVLGDYWPQVHLLVPDWVTHHSPELLDGGLDDPASRPTWTTYMSRADLYDQVFEVARPWYRMAAETPEVWEAAVGRSVGTREVTERLAAHLLIAVLRDLVRVGDGDRLLEVAFENLAADDWSHAYWVVFRGWSDAEEPIPAIFVDRLVEHWRWRLSELAKRDPQEAVDEAIALGWLFHTPFIPVPQLLELGQATARLCNGRLEMYSRWDRMLELAEADPNGAFGIAEAVLYCQARADYPHVPVEDVRPFLDHVLKRGSTDTVDRARRLINQLGERGFRELRDLLT